MTKLKDVSGFSENWPVEKDVAYYVTYEGYVPSTSEAIGFGINTALNEASDVEVVIDVDLMTKIMVDKASEIAKSEEYKLVVKPRQAGQVYFYFNQIATSLSSQPQRFIRLKKG